MTELFDLTGKVAVVTGGSRGMGREMVLAFAQHGADVVIASRKIDACEDLAEEVRDTTGQRALPVACHVGYWDQCDALGDTVYCLLYTSPSPRDQRGSRMPSSA